MRERPRWGRCERKVVSDEDTETGMNANESITYNVMEYNSCM